MTSLMIDFKCAKCARPFSVPEAYAGRKARCKTCGAELVVPPKAIIPAAPPIPNASTASNRPLEPKLPMRTRRLMADAKQMTTAFVGFDAIKVRAMPGDPPDTYQIDYTIKSLERDKKGNPIPRAKHTAEIQLTLDYPRLSPKCKMLTPIFHPNIDPSTICVGDHWTAGERLVDLVIRIGEMLAYLAYNILSPIDGEAAMWADLSREKLPTDPRNLRPPGMD
jgi:ubiquitin-protein ligase/DNA-directed RNA polymerase subunit RPC12/RpoP